MYDSDTMTLRTATRADSRQMADIAGGTASAQALADWMAEDDIRAAWHVLEDEAGVVWGFQRVGPATPDAPDICDIATFLHQGAALRVGSRLFEASAEAARRFGFAWIDASFDTENDSARVYYQSHGFRILNRTADRITMRFDLD